MNGRMWSFVTIEGRRDAGWRINISDASSGVEIDQAAASNVTLRYIQVNGPGMIVESGDVREFNLTPKTGRISNLTVALRGLERLRRRDVLDPSRQRADRILLVPRTGLQKPSAVPHQRHLLRGDNELHFPL